MYVNNVVVVVVVVIVRYIVYKRLTCYAMRMYICACIHMSSVSERKQSEYLPSMIFCFFLLDKKYAYNLFKN